MIKSKTRNFLEFLNSLFSQELLSSIARTRTLIKEKGDLLRKVRMVQQQMNPKAKSELNITTLLLPERYKTTTYYQTLSSEMDKKQKALAMRLKLEEIRKNPDKLNPITKRTALNRSLSDNWLSCIILDYYGWLSEREIYTCRAILYSIGDSGDGYLGNIVPNLPYKPLFPTDKPITDKLSCLKFLRMQQ